MTGDVQEIRTSDEQLVRIALQGDISAFGTLVERHWNVVFALALSRIRDPAEAEDIAQESFLKAYSQLRRLRDSSRFAGWLGKITLQQCANTVRRSIRNRAALGHKTGSLEDAEAMPAYSPNPGLSEGQIRFVRERVRQLPEKARQLIILRFVAGLSAGQIGEQLGKRPGTIRVSLHRAYKILRKDLAKLLEEVRS